ncbi:hypothetical protein CCR95_18405 [Thiocystis minor]|uniref:AAA family ATPase n=1 Tax=Thiocystis minor TaxID=61597 RepID=UPI001913D04A|nr:ATP-dependent Clp protease ATP-binding subunit [Thiocystis minor]MBK5965994.1 hypothetical protein [Thiocystis minor]
MKLSFLSHAASKVMDEAKRAALGDEATEITPLHLLSALAAQAPELITKTLTLTGLEPAKAKKCLETLSAPLAVDVEDDPKRTVKIGQMTWAALRKSESLAVEFPGQHPPLVEPVHLWVALCEEVTARDDQLFVAIDCPDQQPNNLAAVAMTQLPAKASTSLQSKTPARAAIGLGEIETFCRRNLTALALGGRLTPAFGTDTARGELVRNLLKMRQRSVVLTGPAGVGKTKLVEDLALGIVKGEIPALSACTVLEFDLAEFTKGTHFAGSRAERWSRLTKALRSHADEVILFIDELHTIVGVPLEGQSLDMANALKPLMVDDAVRIIGATTSDEYRRYIDGDLALARRFTEVRVPEPDENGVMEILTRVAPTYGSYHQVHYTHDALKAIVDLARLYFPNQAFPAKAVDQLDELGAHARLTRAANLDDHSPIQITRADVEETLRRVRGIEPMAAAPDLVELLSARVIGQDHAVKCLADAVITASLRYGRDQWQRPRAIMLFLGPTGCGKSYLAEVLADILFPGRDHLLTLDMAEFSGAAGGSEHALWRLIGPPPPYVGWENGGLLTSHVLRHPVCVVLVDELDKASPEARNVLLRIFNEGWIEDGRGRAVSFRGVYFVLTANAASEIWGECKQQIGFVSDEQTHPPAQEISESRLRDVLEREGFASEFLGRLTNVVLFDRLEESHLRRIVAKQLAALRDQALVEDFVLLDYDEEALAAWLVERIPEPVDVRRLRATFERRIETPISHWRLREVAQHERPRVLYLRTENDDELNLEAEGGVSAKLRLMQRVAEVFNQRRADETRLQTASAVLI